jgi:hypothetical protein
MLDQIIKDIIKEQEAATVEYTSGGFIYIKAKLGAIIKYNTGDVVLAIFNDGQYKLSIIQTHDNLTFMELLK